MTIKISKKIKGYSVGKPEEAAHSPAAGPDPRAVIEVPPKAEVIQMHGKVERPDTLIGATYKIKSPLFEHALYVTINDIVLNADTEYEMRRPFEIFINSKNMDHFQWIVALTRIISAVFRSDLKDGVEVCITTSSRPLSSGAMSSNFRRCGGASISFEPSTRAAGCASQVGYQKERTSRFIW